MSDESQFTNLATETKYSIVKNRITRAKTPIEDSSSIDVNEKDLKGEEDEEINSTSKLVTFNETSTFVPTVGTEEAEEANETPVELEEAVPHPSSARAVSTPASESSPRPSEITKQSEKMSPIEGSFSEDEVDEENLSITSATTAEENGESDGDDEDGSTKEDGGESDKDNDDDSEKESSNSAVNSTKNSSRGSSAKSVSGSIKSNEDENTKQSSRVSSAKSKADSNDAKIDDDQDNQSEKGADYEKENDENNKTENNSKASSTRNSSRESSAKLEKESNIANENNDDGNESEKADSDTTSNINNEDDKESRASSSKDKDDENDDNDDVKLSGLTVNASSTKNSSRASSAKENNESQRDSENKDDVQSNSADAKNDNDDESEKNSKAESSKDSSRASSAKSNESKTSKVSTGKSSLKSENEAKAKDDNDEEGNDDDKEDGHDDDKEYVRNSSGNTTKASSRKSSGKSTKSDDENESDKNSSDNSTKASSRESSAKSTGSSGSDDDASKVNTRRSSAQLENKAESKVISEDENKSDDEDGGNESDVDINDVGSISSSKKKEDIDTSLLNQDSVASSRQSSAKSNRLISRRVSVEVLSDAETSKVTEGVIDSNDSMKEDTSSNEKKEASDSGTEEKPPRKERNRVKKSKDTQFLKTALISAAPTIAAGGTVFATASRRKIPAHLKNVKSVIAKTFHENETYNSNGDSGVEGSTTSGDSPKNFDTPRKLNALDKRKLPRSKSVPRPPFSLITSKASNESNKRVPMNKIVLQPKHPKINLKKVKPRISTLENANYKPGGGQVKISVKKLEWKAVSRTNATNEKYDEAKQKDDSKPKRKKHNYSIGPGAMKNTREINKRVAEKRSKYQRAWAAHPVPNGKNGSTVDNGETIEQENKTDDEEEGKASIDEQKEEKDLEVGSGQADEAKVLIYSSLRTIAKYCSMSNSKFAFDFIHIK